MKRILSIVGVLTLCACSSTHDLKTDGYNFFGGGFIDDQVGEGLYLIKGFSNTSLFVTKESAANTFSYRAKQLCPEGFTEVRTLINAYESATPGLILPSNTGFIEAPREVITSKIGYVLCSNSPMTYNKARAIVASKTE